jgi:hypothetical protein
VNAHNGGHADSLYHVSILFGEQEVLPILPAIRVGHIRDQRLCKVNHFLSTKVGMSRCELQPSETLRMVATIPSQPSLRAT